MSWDDPDFEPPPPPVKWDEEEDLKESWEDPDAEPKKPEASSSQTGKPKPKKSDKKGASKSKATPDLPENDSDKIELTEKEREELQRKKELEMMGELFGTGSEREEEGFVLDSEDDAKNLADKIGTRLKNLQGSDHYKVFLSDLFYKLAQDLDAVSVRKLGSELTALGNDIQQKTLAKKQQHKKKAPQIKAGAKQSLLGDVVDEEFAGGGAAFDDDFDDFM